VAYSQSGSSGEWAVPDPHDRNSTGAERLLDAVLCLLIEQGTDLLADALRPEDVTRRAGKSRASYYRTDGFPATATDAAARRKVLEAALDRGLRNSSGDLGQMLGAVDELLATSQTRLTPQDFVRAATADNYDSYVDGTDWLQFFVSLLSISSHPLRTSLSDFYTTVTDAYVAAYTKALGYLGYEIRPPFTMRQFTLATMCLADGMMARRMSDPSITRDLYVDLIEHLATSMLVRQGSTPEPMTTLDVPVRGHTVPPTRGEIISAAMRLFARERLDMPTIAELADAAGCSERTVETHVGGVAGAIRAAWEEWAPWFDESVEHDRRSMRDPDPLTLLYRLANRVATRAAENRALSRALLMLDVSGSAPRSGRPDPVGALFERLLLEAADRGDFNPPTASRLPFDAERVGVFAMVLRSNVLNMVLSVPADTEASPADHARGCVDYVWATMMPPRRDSRDEADPV